MGSASEPTHVVDGNDVVLVGIRFESREAGLAVLSLLEAPTHADDLHQATQNEPYHWVVVYYEDAVRTAKARRDGAFAALGEGSRNDERW